MPRFIAQCCRKLEIWRYRGNVKRAVALHLRGEVRGDGLLVEHLCCHLEIRWRPRDLHPWDQDHPAPEREMLRREQAMADTEAAIHRLFEQLPYVDVIDLSVLEPGFNNPIIAGTAHR
jgi:hypothetical protein